MTTIDSTSDPNEGGRKSLPHTRLLEIATWFTGCEAIEAIFFHDRMELAFDRSDPMQVLSDQSVRGRFKSLHLVFRGKYCFRSGATDQWRTYEIRSESPMLNDVLCSEVMQSSVLPNGLLQVSFRGGASMIFSVCRATVEEPLRTGAIQHVSLDCLVPPTSLPGVGIHA